MSAIALQLERILGTTAVSPWEGLELEVQAAIQQAIAPPAHPDCIVYPQTLEELGEVMACAYQNRWRVLPCGAGTKLAWGGLAEGIHIVLSTARLNRLIDHAVGDLTVTAEAGMKLSDLQAKLAQEGQFLAIDPMYGDRATLGGIVATADTGALRQRYGGIRDMLIGLSFVRFDGQSAKAGGQVVKNVAGYDLMKLFTGSYGTLGLISQVTFRLYPLPATSQTVVLTGAAETLAKATQALLASALTPIMVDILSAQTVYSLQIGKGMGLLVRFQGLEVAVEQQVNQLKQIGQILELPDTTLTGQGEKDLWQRLQNLSEAAPPVSMITCKIGVLPSHGAIALNTLSTLLPLTMGLIHAASGLGILRMSSEAVSPRLLKEARQICQSHQGFLTLLEAPQAMKQQMDVWGYTGNALTVMQTMKQQFDPENLFSPHRFVSGI